MITSAIGKLFLKAYNQKYKQHYDARTFFDEVYFPLALDNEKLMLFTLNSPFCNPSNKNKTNKEKLEILHQKIYNKTIDASTAVGYAASDEKKFQSTSNQVSNIEFQLSEEDIYSSWIGASLGIEVLDTDYHNDAKDESNRLSILFFAPDILLYVFEGWKEYRKCLNDYKGLKGNKIEAWNAQWITHILSDSFINGQPQANFNPLSSNKKGELYIKEQTWVNVLFAISQHTSHSNLMGYVYNLGVKINSTIGFIPFFLNEFRKPIDLYKKIFGKSSDLQNWGKEQSFRNYCRLGNIGINAMSPWGIYQYLRKGKNCQNELNVNLDIYKIWILAMLNNEELWELSLNFAQSLDCYIKEDERVLSNLRTNQVNNILKAKDKRGFVINVLEIMKESKNKETIMSVAKEINSMKDDKVCYFIALVRLHYESFIKQ